MELKRRLRAWRFQRLRSLGVEGSLRCASVLAGCVLLAAALDRAFSFPQAARWGLFLAGGGALLAGVYVWLLRPLRGLRAPRLLSDVSGRYPELRAYLRSSWELSHSKPAPNTSAELAGEHLERTEALLSRLPRETIFRWSPSRKAALSLGLAAAAWTLCMPWLSDDPATFARVLTPWRDVKLDALVAVHPGDRNVLWAEPVEIRAKWRERRSSRESGLTLWARSEASGWSRVPWDREDGESGAFRLTGLTSVLEYRVGHSDLRTRVYRLTPLPFPHLRDITLRVRLPGRGPGIQKARLEEGGEIAALRGSWVTLKGRPDRRLKTGSLSLSFLNTPVPMRRLETGEWEASFPLTENGTLKLDLLSAAGARDPEPVAYAVRALEDEPPAVELLSPTFEVEVSPREKLPVTYSAEDDYGLTDVSLIYSINGGPDRLTPLKRFKVRPKEHIGDHEWDLSELPIGARVEFRIRASDNNRPASQTSVSEKGVLHIADFESAHAATERRWVRAEEALRRLAGKESGMRKLLAAATTAPAPGLLPAIDRADRELGDAWDKAVKDLDEFSRMMEEDPYANPGMSVLTRALSKAMEGIRDTDVKEARRSVASRDWKAARKSHADLEAKVRRALELLSGGREMQAMQDLWAEANRMHQASSGISESLQKISKSGQAPTGEQRRKLDEAMSKLQRQIDGLKNIIRSLPKVDAESLRKKNRKLYVMPVGAAQKTMKAMRDAMARGDYESAARLAKRLAKQLERMIDALMQAAQSQAGRGGSASKELEDILKLWKEVVEQQSQSLQVTSRVDDQKLKARLLAMESVLHEVSRLQEEVLRDAESSGPVVPRRVKEAMREVLKEFRAGQVKEAPGVLEKIIGGLKAKVLHYPPRKEGPAPESLKLMELAARERAILERLKTGVPEPMPTEGQLSEMFAAMAMQGQVRRKTADLEGRLAEVSKRVGTLPPDTIRSVQEAQVEQLAAERALGVRDSAKARGHQERALELLSQGQKSCSSALQQQQQIQQSSTQPFGGSRSVVRPYGGRGRKGMDTGFVPLPRAEDYQPPQEIRREIERSLRERRPRIFDDAVNEYLKRMSR